MKEGSSLSVLVVLDFFSREFACFFVSNVSEEVAAFDDLSGVRNGLENIESEFECLLGRCGGCRS
jgi:hypothetical protein